MQSENMNTSEALRIATTRAAEDPTFLGHVLTIYREHERLSEDQLAEVWARKPSFYLAYIFVSGPIPPLRILQSA